VTFRLENHFFGEGRRALTATKVQTRVKKAPRLLRTKWIRLTRSISLDGRDGEKGSIQLVDQALADDLVAWDSAVLLNPLSLFFSRIWFFITSRTNDKREGRKNGSHGKSS
jgi:hypothetical protein